MRDPYLWLKFIHVLAIAAWIGGYATFAVLNAITRRQGDASAVTTYLGYAQKIGARLAEPGAMLALLSGIGMMLVGHTGMPIWIIWGLVAAALFIVVGFVAQRPVLMQLMQRASGGGTAEDFRALLGRQQAIVTVNLLILTSAVWAMIVKPS